MTTSSITHTPTARYDPSHDGWNAAAVLDATLAELDDRGYAAASLRTIATRANVPLETVFDSWGSKQHLVLAAVAHLARKQPTPETGDLRTDLVQVTEALGDLLMHPGAAEVLRSLLSPTGCQDGVGSFPSGGPLGERRAVIRRIVERGQRRQQLSSSVHAGLVADALVGALVFRHLVSGDAVTRQTAGRLVDLVVDANPGT